MEEEPTLSGENRNPDGTFAVGNPGGPGRPPGSVSIVAKIKQKFLEDPEYFEEWVSKLMEDPSNRKAILEQIDGKPLVTLRDAALYITKLPKAEHDAVEWQAAMEALRHPPRAERFRLT
jgi:hypothetical protein